VYYGKFKNQLHGIMADCICQTCSIVISQSLTMLLWVGTVSAEGIIAGSRSYLCKNLKRYLGLVRECDR
jgi:hypothetical protein